jgi:hypothetical protein
MEAVDVEVVSSAEHALHAPTYMVSADSAPTLETEPSSHVKFGLEKHVRVDILPLIISPTSSFSCFVDVTTARDTNVDAPGIHETLSMQPTKLPNWFLRFYVVTIRREMMLIASQRVGLASPL